MRNTDIEECFLPPSPKTFRFYVQSWLVGHSYLLSLVAYVHLSLEWVVVQIVRHDTPCLNSKKIFNVIVSFSSEASYFAAKSMGNVKSYTARTGCWLIFQWNVITSLLYVWFHIVCYCFIILSNFIFFISDSLVLFSVFSSSNTSALSFSFWYRFFLYRFFYICKFFRAFQEFHFLKLIFF